MPSITLTFPNSINVSAQVGDTAYYTNDVNGETIVEIGTNKIVDPHKAPRVAP